MSIRSYLFPLLFVAAVAPTVSAAQQATSPRAEVRAEVRAEARADTRSEARALAPSAATRELELLSQQLAHAPSAWREEGRYPQDPADSLYREARTLLNRGEWRKSATLFAQVANRTPASAYAADALYWQAFALYRIGGLQDLRDALAALDARKARFPRAGNGDEAESLGTRIVGALAQRGDATAQARLRSQASAAALECDSEEQSVRSSALSTLMRNNPEAAGPLLVRVLDRRDECSVALRKSAVMMIGTKGDDASKAKLHDVAKSDPSESVRSDAISYLARISGDEIVATLDAVIRNDGSVSVQRAAVRALGNHGSAKARAAIRALVERSTAPEQLRLDAISTLESGAPLIACAGQCNDNVYVVTGSTMPARVVGSSAGGSAPAVPPVPPVPAVAAAPAAAPAPVAYPGQVAPAGWATTPEGGAWNQRARDNERHISLEDAAWLRGIYTRLETTRLKSRAVYVLARAEDEATLTWLMGIVQREEEPSDVRSSLLSRLGNDLPIVQLNRLYDGVATRQVREQIVSVLGRRKEPEATDKLIEIARTGTDPQLRRSAISALTSKKDPRTTQLLLELVDR